MRGLMIYFLFLIISKLNSYSFRVSVQHELKKTIETIQTFLIEAALSTIMWILNNKLNPLDTIKIQNNLKIPYLFCISRQCHNVAPA